MNDGFDTGDGAVYSFAKGISNVTILSDAVAKQASKLLAETASVSDSGTLRMQNYSDLTYFLEDYVGVSRVF